MTEQVLAHLVRCRWSRCRRLMLDRRVPAHEAMHRRINLLHATRMEMNARGVDFQPGQVWAAKHTRRRAARKVAQR